MELVMKPLSCMVLKGVVKGSVPAVGEQRVAPGQYIETIPTRTGEGSSHWAIKQGACSISICTFSHPDPE